MEYYHCFGDRKLFPKLKRWEWTVIICGFTSLTMNTGVLASYGVVFDDIMEDFDTTALITSWAASLAFGFTVGAAPVSTALYTMYSARKIILGGAVCAVGCIIVTSFTSSIPVLFLFYSFGFGVSGNFMYNTYMNIIGDSFKKEAIAVGSCFSSCGVAMGTLAMNPVAAVLTSNVGWRNSFRIIAVAGFVVNVAGAAMLPAVSLVSSSGKRREREEEEQREVDEIVYQRVEDDFNFTAANAQYPSTRNLPVAGAGGGENNNEEDEEEGRELNKRRSVMSKLSMMMGDLRQRIFTSRRPLNLHLFANLTLWLWLVSTFTRSVAFFFPQIFLVDYQKGLGVAEEVAALKLTIYGVFDMCGRIFAALMGDRLPFDLAYLYVITVSICAIVSVLLASLTHRFVIYLYVILLGFNGGVYGSLEFAATMEIFGRSNGFYVWGYINVMLMAGFVSGPAIVGGLLDGGYSYNTGFYLASAFLAFSALVTLFIPCSARRYPMVDRQQREEAKRNMRQLQHITHRTTTNQQQEEQVAEEDETARKVPLEVDENA